MRHSLIGEWKEPDKAFEDAVEQGRLSWSAGDDNYVGHYMYMGTSDGKDYFKHINTRRYLP